MSESQKYLIAVAQKAGFLVSARQLARWHREGLLPRPKQESLGRGRGTRSVYPDGTADQLIALCEFKKSGRRLDYLAWHLWWEGFDVGIGLIREFINSNWNSWDLDIRNLTDRKSGDLNDKTLRTLKKAGLSHFKNNIVRQARRRIGRILFGGFVVSITRVVAGRFETMDTELLEKAMGLVPTGHHKESPMWMPEGITDEDVSSLSSFMKNEFQKMRVDKLSDEQLIEARDKLRAIIEFLALLRQTTEGPRIRMGLSIINPLLQRPVYQCHVLRFHIAAESGSLRNKLLAFEEMMVSLRETMERLVLAQECFEALRNEIPEIAEQIKSWRVIAASVNETNKEKYLLRLGKEYVRNKDALDQFWQRHPQYQKLGLK